jgi:hypothetical protein
MPNGPEGIETPTQVTPEDINQIVSVAPVAEQNWLERLYTNVAAVLGVAFQGVWNKLDQIFTFKVTYYKRAMATTKDNEVIPLLKVITNQFQKSGWLDSRTAEMIEKLHPDNPVLDLIYTWLVGVSLLKNYLGTAATGMSGNLIQSLNKEYRPNLPDPQSVIRSAFIAPEKTGDVRDILKRAGLKDEDIDLLFISHYSLYDIQTLRTLYLWKLIDKDKAFERLREMGFTDTRINEIMQTWTIIPPVQDLLMMVAKEAFEPDQIEAYGLDLEFPSDQSEWMEKQGLTDFWQRKYWAAHWNYPSPQQVLELLHRGIIDKEEVNQYYRVVEMPKFWREKLQEASFNVFTRVDTRRMHQMGVLTDEELVKAYTDQGYDLDHALKMAEFTKRYNSQDQLKITKSQIVKAYRNAMINREEATLLFQTIKTNAEEIEWLLVNADFDENLELQNLYVGAIKTRYVNLLMSDNDARIELIKLNLPGARVDALLTAWKATITASSKMPSKTDLDKFLKAGIINADTYRTEMYKLGYSFNYIEWYLAGTGKAATPKTVIE